MKIPLKFLNSESVAASTSIWYNVHQRKVGRTMKDEQYTHDLPNATATILSIYRCKMCQGWGINYREKECPPCSVCGGAGMLLPGETITIELAANQYKERNITYISVLAAIKYPFNGKANYAPAIGIVSMKAWGPNALKNCALSAAILALRNEGIKYTSIQLEGKVEWPDGWIKQELTGFLWDYSEEVAAAKLG